MSDIKGRICGFKVGAFEFSVPAGSTLKDIVEQNDIDLSDGTIALNGERITASALANTSVPADSEIRVSKAAKGGTEVTTINVARIPGTTKLFCAGYRRLV